MRERCDPRAQQLARQVASNRTRPRFALVPPASAASLARQRQDPRASRLAAVVAKAPRLRLAWQGGGGMRPSIPEREKTASPAPPTVTIIAEPAYLVFAVIEASEGALSSHDREVLAAARCLADHGGGAVVALGPQDIAEFGSAGADRVLAYGASPETSEPAVYDPEGHAAFILAAIDTYGPRHVIFAESTEGADIARRVAAVCGERLFSGATSVSAKRISRRMRAGTMEMSTAPARFISIACDTIAPHSGSPHEARGITMAGPAVQRRFVRAVSLPLDSDAIALEEADFVLSAGNGVSDWAGFAELAHLLGATRGGSRVVCDEGHLPRDRQVGASGTRVTARAYFALGISGAPQHLQGITEVAHVVAVNTDLHAEMIKRADLAIIADAQDIIRALIRHAKAQRNG